MVRWRQIPRRAISKAHTPYGKSGLKMSTITAMKMAPEILAEIVLMQETQGLTHKQCVDILNEVLANGITPNEAKEKLHIIVQSSDSSEILGFVTEVLDANPQSIADFKNGKDRAKGFLVGQVMKKILK